MNQDWPIRPTFLRKLDHRTKLRPNEDDLNENGIFTKTSLQGFIAVVTHDINIDKSATLIEFIPNYLLDKLKSEPESLITQDLFPSHFKDKIRDVFILRTESFGYREINPVCNHFRKIEGCNNRTCYNQDTTVLLNCLKGLNEDNYYESITRYIKTTTSLQGLNVEVCSSNGNHYIKYECNITGFVELCFPIFFEKKIIGALLSGGILSDNSTFKSIKDKIAKYYNKNEYQFDIKELDNSIKQSIKKSSEFKQRIFLEKVDDSIDIRIKNIVGHIKILEERISKRVNFHRYKYISENFKEIKRDINESIDSRVLTSDIAEINKAIKKALRMHNIAFPNKGFIILFGAKDFTNPGLLFPIAYVGDKYDLSKYSFDTNMIKGLIDKGDATFTNHQYPSIVNGLLKKGKEQTDYNPDKDILRFFQTKSPTVSFIIWKQYDENWEFPVHENTIEELYTNAMLEFYSTIALNYSIFWSKKIEEKLGDAMRVAGHESRQIILHLKDTLESNFQYQNQIQYLISNNNYGNKYRDLEIYLKLLNKVVERPSFLSKPIEIHSQEIELYELLKSIRSLHLAEALHKDKSINLIKSDEIKANADELLLMQVFYNLFDNAVKYSYNGTAINIILEDFKEKVRITVESFGPQIVESDIIYTLYYRGKNVEFLEDGLGIGMYVSKRIIEAHQGGSISHSSKLMSPYNISCLEFLLRCEKPSELINDEESLKSLILQAQKLDFNSSIGYTHDGKPRYYPRRMTFFAELNRKTFTNKFYININK
ncbi:MAG: HAMP domain-containing histidine kinase [Prolixibacteraceae bacterium]|nr:HAMP domain-containing histidine kinase [Prolixibacteraceae bacterium]